MKKMSEKREWTNGTGRTNRKSGEMMNTRARRDQNNGKSGKNGGKPWTSTEKTLKSMDKKSAVQVTEHHGHAAKRILSARILNPAAGVSIWTCRMRSS